MLQVLSGSQIVFEPFSEIDLRLKGEIKIRNPNPDRYIVFKIKSTDINAFEADPSKGVLNPRQTMIIPVLTTRTVDAQYARALAQKNKFLIQYAFLNSRPDSLEEATTKLRGPASQNVKIYINTNSIRGGSKLGTTNLRQPSIAGSNKYSFRSMAPNAPVVNSNYLVGNGNTANSNQIDRLRSEIDYLQKQRARFTRDAERKGKDGGKGGYLKYIIFLGLGFIAGNYGSKYAGLNTYLKQQYAHFKVKAAQVAHQPQKKQQQQGFFSIFNFGGDDQPQKVVVEQQKKSWWNIL